MDAPHRPPTRAQEIFNLGLPVEAVSLYLLCSGLVDAGQPLSLATIAPTWNLDRDALEANLNRLLRRGILTTDGALGDEAARFQLQPATRWNPSDGRHSNGL